MILLLDNCPRRAEEFRRRYHVCWAESADVAVFRLLSDPPGTYTAIWLDHDLGRDQPTGLDVAEVMARERLHVNTPVIIHSANYVGAMKMKEVLEKTHRVSFGEVADGE